MSDENTPLLSSLSIWKSTIFPMKMHKNWIPGSYYFHEFLKFMKIVFKIRECKAHSCFGNLEFPTNTHTYTNLRLIHYLEIYLSPRRYTMLTLLHYFEMVQMGYFRRAHSIMRLIHLLEIYILWWQPATLVLIHYLEMDHCRRTHALLRLTHGLKIY